MNKNIKAVIWDMGGVLLRTEDHNPRKSLCEKYRLSPEELEKLVFNNRSAVAATLGKISGEDHWKSVQAELNISNNEMHSFIDQFWSGDREDRVLLEYIKKLGETFKIALLSNAWSNIRKEVEANYSLLDYFPVQIFSAEIKLAKPDRQIYEYALNQLKVSPDEAVFIDDVQKNVDGAKEAGLPAFRFESSSGIISTLNEFLQR